MSLESTSSVAAPSASTAQPGKRHAGRRADGGAAAESPFAQLLQGQRRATDALAAPEPAPAQPGAGQEASARQEGDDTTTAEQDDDSSGATNARPPRKDQLSAEDLPAVPMPVSGAAAGGADALGRLLGAQRAQARQAALGAERGREARQLQGRSAEAEGAAALVASPFADALARAAGRPGGETGEMAGAAPAAGGVAAGVPAQAPGAEAVLPSLAAPGDAAPPPVAAPAAGPAPVPDAYATLGPAPGSEAFPAALGAQLSTWVSEGVEHAVLELNPRELGPIEVHIALRDGATRIELGSDVASTRDALNQALPQLADALGDVGLALAGGQVSDQASGQRSPDGGDAQAQARQAGAWLRGSGAGGDSGAVQSAGPLPRPPVNPRALLDMYA